MGHVTEVGTLFIPNSWLVGRVFARMIFETLGEEEEAMVCG